MLVAEEPTGRQEDWEAGARQLRERQILEGAAGVLVEMPREQQVGLGSSLYGTLHNAFSILIKFTRIHQ